MSPVTPNRPPGLIHPVVRGATDHRPDAETAAVLKTWRRTQLEERMAFEGEWQDTGFIFTRRNGTLQDPDVVSQRFDKIVSRLGLPPVRFHDYADLRVMPTWPVSPCSAGVGALMLSA